MDALLPVMKGHPGPFVLVFAVVFRVVHHLLRKLPMPKAVKQNDLHSWKWRNLTVSVAHSLLTGTWSLACVVASPEILINIYSFHTPMSYLLVCTSTGYFVQDAADIILTGHARGSWEFLLHHSLVISSFSYALYTHLYVAGAVIALFVEVNSITLHLRLLLKLAGAQSSSFYNIIKFINFLTFVMFRLSAQFYLTWYLIQNYSWLDNSGFFLICIGMMNVMILVYFYRLLRADFFPRSKVGQNGTHKNSTKFLTD